MTITATTTRVDGVAISGATGRLGSHLVQACGRQSISTTVLPRSGPSAVQLAARPVDVVIDTSVAAAADISIATSRMQDLPLVYCVSNPGEQVLAALHDLSECVPVVLAANLSPIHWVHARATREAAQRFAALGLPVEVTVHDRHPATKRDAPSATARELGARAGGSPDLLSTRSGGPVSDHSVRFSTAAASYELTHSVRDLRLSAEGALLPAGRLLGRPAGLYTTDDLYSEIAGEAKGTSR